MSEEKKEIQVDPDKERVLNEMKRKANEIHTYLKLNQKEYSMDDYLSFAFVTLMNSTSILPQFMVPTKYMLNLYIDGVLQMEEMKKDMNNGILLVKE